MGFLKDLFGPPKKNDGFFGEIVYENKQFWEGRKHFKPIDKEVEVLIDGDLKAPHSLQKRFYSELEKRYQGFTEKLGEDFHLKLKQWRDDITLCDVWRHITLICVHIPECKSDDEQWELIYEIKDDKHSFVVLMVGYEVQAVQVDD